MTIKTFIVALLISSLAAPAFASTIQDAATKTSLSNPAAIEVAYGKNVNTKPTRQQIMAGAVMGD